MKLPVDYTQLNWRKGEVRAVREQYVADQKGQCMHCNSPLNGWVPAEITEQSVDWTLFPENFLVHPVHLHHNHDTGMTEGAVHAYCNAVLWQHHGR